MNGGQASRRHGIQSVTQNDMAGLRAPSSAGSFASVRSASSRTSRSSAFIPPPDLAFTKDRRRSPSPTSSSVSFASRRGSRVLVTPGREAALFAGGELGDDDVLGVYGMMSALEMGEGLGMGSQQPFRLPEKRDPGFRNAVLKHLYSHHPMLTTLDMSEAGLNDSDMPRLSDAIGTNTVLRSLSLATNTLTHECMPDLTAAIEQNISLRSIDLGENAIGSRGAGLLAQNLAEKTKLMGLDLSSNLVRDEGCRAVLDAIQRTPGQPIQWLSLCENQVSDHSAADIASMLDICKNLTFLDLSRNSFFSNGIRVIAEELGLNKTLKHLNLSNIALGSDAIELLAASLARNHGLISLDMYGCQIGDAGARAIGAALAHNETLKRLDLGSNKMAAAGGALLADGLMINSVLQVPALPPLSLLRDGQLTRWARVPLVPLRPSTSQSRCLCSEVPRGF
jgi:Ran GTPase-activating protein (RanGAP) involved in mRNA processing and transport